MMMNRDTAMQTIDKTEPLQLKQEGKHSALPSLAFMKKEKKNVQQ